MGVHFYTRQMLCDAAPSRTAQEDDLSMQKTPGFLSTGQVVTHRLLKHFSKKSVPDRSCSVTRLAQLALLILHSRAQQVTARSPVEKQDALVLDACQPEGIHMQSTLQMQILYILLALQPLIISRILLGARTKHGVRSSSSACVFGAIHR